MHNEEVVGRLRARGYAMRGEQQRQDLPETDAVLVTAHGISDASTHLKG